MKKAGLITIALVLVAAGIIVFYQMQGSGQKTPLDKGQGTKVKEHSDKEQGTLVKEYIEWKKYYM